MRGIILLEGADGTGKTTLAKAIEARCKNSVYLHNGLYPNMWNSHLECVKEAVKLSREHVVIIDRLWISEQIYGTVFRGGPAYNLGARCLDRVLQRFNCLTVVCARNNMPKHLKHFEELKETREEKFQQMEEVAVRYLDLARGNMAVGMDTYVEQLSAFQDFSSRLDVAFYDMDLFHGEKHVGDFAGALLERLQARHKHWNLEPTTLEPQLHNLVGSMRTAEYLFVGEELSPQADNFWPFVWNDDLSAATWLNQALHDLKFNETKGLWTNARGPENWLKTIHDRNPKIKVITLGAIAATKVEREAPFFTDVRNLVHPQWARRFQHGAPEIFRNTLREALS